MMIKYFFIATFAFLCAGFIAACTDSKKQSADKAPTTEIAKATELTDEQNTLLLDSIIESEKGKLPQQVEDWRLINISRENNWLTYTYQAIDHLADDYCVTPEEIKQKSRRRIAIDPKRSAAKALGLDIRCTYLDKEGEILYDIELKKDQY